MAKKSERFPIYEEKLPWNQAEPDDVGQAMLGAWRALESIDGGTARAFAEACVALYEGNPEIANPWSAIGAPTDGNAIQSVTDTQCAHIYQNKVKPFILTEDGNYEDRTRAEGMMQFIEGLFLATEIYGKLGKRICWDGAIFGAGIVKVVPDEENNEVRHERVFIWELLVDTEDAKRGTPRQLFHPRPVSRAALVGMFRGDPKLVDIIHEAPCAPEDPYMPTSTEHHERADRVLVVEGWSLPSASVDVQDPGAYDVNDKHDGRHTLVVVGEAGADNSAGVLIDEGWPYAHFPFAIYTPKARPFGIFGQPIPQVLAAVQMQINRLSLRINDWV
jgi:hypothetical protein